MLSVSIRHLMLLTITMNSRDVRRARSPDSRHEIAESLHLSGVFGGD